MMIGLYIVLTCVSAAFCLAVAVDTALYSTLRGNLAVLVTVNSDDIVDYVPKGSILVGNEEVGENGLLRVYYPVDGWVNTGDGSINVIAFKNANRQNSLHTDIYPLLNDKHAYLYVCRLSSPAMTTTAVTRVMKWVSTMSFQLRYWSAGSLRTLMASSNATNIISKLIGPGRNHQKRVMGFSLMV